jgi:hypothetical protein
MKVFQGILVVLFLAILGYTAIVAANHGLGLFQVFFADIASMGWAGQFNVDFMSMLTLSGLWLAWRHEFSPAGIVMGILGFFGGGLVLSLYLLIVSVKENGDMRVVLLGARRAQQA